MVWGVRLVRSGGGVDVTCTTSPAGDEPLDVVLYVLVLSGWCAASGGVCTPRLSVLCREHVCQPDGLPMRFSRDDMGHQRWVS